MCFASGRVNGYWQKPSLWQSATLQPTARIFGGLRLTTEKRWQIVSKTFFDYS
jgi:hypothetical protein